MWKIAVVGIYGFLGVPILVLLGLMLPARSERLQKWLYWSASAFFLIGVLGFLFLRWRVLGEGFFGSLARWKLSDTAYTFFLVACLAGLAALATWRRDLTSMLPAEAGEDTREDGLRWVTRRCWCYLMAIWGAVVAGFFGWGFWRNP